MRPSAWLAWVAVLGAPGVVLADGTPDEARARTLFDDAVAGRCPDACACYEQSLALVESTSARLNLADCLEHRGSLANARGQWQRAVESMPEDDARRAAAAARLESLDGRLARMVFRFVVPPPAGTHVRVDGVDLGPAALRGANVVIDPGRHTVSIDTPGEASRSFPIELEEGSKKSLVIEQATPPQAAPPQAEAPLPVRSVPNPPRTRRGSAGAEVLDLTGIIVAGLGAGALLAAGVTALVIADNDGKIGDECPDKRCTTRGLDLIDENEGLLTANTILFGVAGVGLLAGGGVLLAAEAVRPSGTAFDVVPLDHGVAFVVRGSLP